MLCDPVWQVTPHSSEMTCSGELYHLTFDFDTNTVMSSTLVVNGPCLLDYLILKLRLPVILYVSFAVDSR